MAAAKKNSREDSAWLVTRARDSLKSDPHAAKAWLITARTLFPGEFSVQYEAYSVEQAAGNTTGAAKMLYDMFTQFSDETILQAEVHKMTSALQSDSRDPDTVFYTGMFESLPSSAQRDVLLKSAEKSGNAVDHCRLMLLLLTRFPDTRPEHGVKLVDTLLDTEKRESLPSPVNCYRKLLVCDTIPLVCSSPDIDVSHKQLYRWLQKAMEFYICFLTQPPCREGSKGPVLSSDKSPLKRQASVFGGLTRHASIEGLTDKESVVLDPWERLHELMMTIGCRCGWEINMASLQEERSLSDKWLCLKDLYNKESDDLEDSSQRKHILYSATFLLYQCVHNYTVAVQPELFSGSTSHSPPLVLVEDIRNRPAVKERKSGKPVKKRRKLEAGEDRGTSDDEAGQRSGRANIQMSKSGQVPPEGMASFRTAIDCWKLLHKQHVMEKDFSRLNQHWKTEGWVWLQSFIIDMLLYQGDQQKAVSLLEELLGSCSGKDQEDNRQTLLRLSLQLSSCQFCLGNYQRACELALDAIAELPVEVQPGDTVPSKQQKADKESRQLLMLSCTEADILPYCVHVLVTCLKRNALGDSEDDMSLGHLMVMLQYDWPSQEALFIKAVEKIVQQGSFTYNIFFNYVINIDMLEEFAFLKTPEGGKINLDLLPVSTTAISRQRTVTRGVHKGVKEDFRLAMERQVARCSEHVDTLIKKFLTEERDIILQNLL
ncbi:PREDICTED: integrator complex subunit 10-like [Branchiostoma belcheri]|uniref:Integrator complex subunit 10 n=1 Tax=Branchiostoma belcheri TaxID=7741 RepID=A0A6P4YSM3_BRABE|nr:PREDICTED: integrator complex subunit 10-like [Branchiostoma belcheri]